MYKYKRYTSIATDELDVRNAHAFGEQLQMLLREVFLQSPRGLLDPLVSEDMRFPEEIPLSSDYRIRIYSDTLIEIPLVLNQLQSYLECDPIDLLDLLEIDYEYVTQKGTIELCVFAADESEEETV